MRVARALLITAASLVWLSGCETAPKLGNLFHSDDATQAVPPDADATGSVSPDGNGRGLASPGLLGADPNDDLSMGKRYFRQEDFGLAEHYFRRAVESHPKDGEAWLDLAAAYDRLRRFDLADRAYSEATAIAGPTAEVLNNQGYSYILRGDYRRAREKLMAAQARDPKNPYIVNNIALLKQSAAQGKAVQ